jgi:hypothetical protein
MTVQLKREGKGGIDHHPPIEANDFFIFYSTLKTIDPTSFQQKVFSRHFKMNELMFALL